MLQILNFDNSRCKSSFLNSQQRTKPTSKTTQGNHIRRTTTLFFSLHPTNHSLSLSLCAICPSCDTVTVTVTVSLCAICSLSLSLSLCAIHQSYTHTFNEATTRFYSTSSTTKTMTNSSCFFPTPNWESRYYARNDRLSPAYTQGNSFRGATRPRKR